MLIVSSAVSSINMANPTSPTEKPTCVILVDSLMDGNTALEWNVGKKLHELNGCAKAIKDGILYLHEAYTLSLVHGANDKEKCILLDSVFWSRVHGAKRNGDRPPGHNLP